MPQGCSLFGVIRNGTPTPLRADTVLAEGDKVIAIGRPGLRGRAAGAADRVAGRGLAPRAEDRR